MKTNPEVTIKRAISFHEEQLFTILSNVCSSPEIYATLKATIEQATDGEIKDECLKLVFRIRDDLIREYTRCIHLYEKYIKELS